MSVPLDLPPVIPSVPIGCRVYATCTQGGRKYMEDTYHVSYQCCKEDNKPNDLQFIYLAIFDGHGGDVAAIYARDHLCQNIIRQRSFWSKDDSGVTQAITKGFLQTHYDMMKEVVNWPKTASGLPSTSGTTASIVFIMNGKYYTGHVGDSRIVLGRKNEETGKWMSCSLTRDHKPESPREKRRIEAAGGQVMNKSGVDRVVWNRPKLGHKGPIRRSTSFDQIPFLAVARSLGDLWSFNSQLNTFIVSPEPDVKCIPIDANDTCLLLASDGLWNMMMTQTAIKVLQEVEEDKYSPELMEAVFGCGSTQMSPSRALVHFCLNRWYQSRFRADNTTVLAVMIDHNQGVQLNPTPSINTNFDIFNDYEDSDDGYDEGFDAIHYFGQLIDHQKNDINSENYINQNLNSEPIPSLLPSGANNTLTTVPQDVGNTSQLSLSVSSNTSITNNSENCSEKVTSIVISESKDSINSNIDLETSEQNSMVEITTSGTTEKTDIQEYDENQINESSRDSGTDSPIAITSNDQLTDEEYAALPSLVNLSQNQWELFVEIDPKDIHSKTSNFVVSGLNEDNIEDKTSTDNSLEDNEEKTPLNNYIYYKSFVKQSFNTNTNEFGLNDNNFWSESPNYFTLTSIKPRSSLPLNFGDNYSDESSHMSKDRTPTTGDNLCIFGALKSCSNSFNNNTPSDSKMLSPIFESNNQLINKNMSEDNHNNSNSNEFCLRNNTLLRRISINKNKPRLTLLPKSATKRKYSPDFSPPSKHLRSSLWTRPLVSREQLMQLSFTRSLKQLAVGRLTGLTRSRLRPLKLLKSFKTNSQK